MSNPIKIVQEYFPSASDKQANSVLWACTGYPAFFHTTETKTKEDCLREQLKNISERAKGDPEVAMCIADEDLEKVMVSDADRLKNS